MCRFRGVIAIAWVSIVVAGAVGIGVNLLFSPMRTDLPSWLAPLALSPLLILSVLWWKVRQDCREQDKTKWEVQQERLRKQFRLFKDAQALQPADFGFELVAGNDARSETKRPYDLKYVPRRAIRVYEFGGDEEVEEYDHDGLVDALRRGRNLVLLGQPTEGKTRTLYEAFRQMIGYVVVQAAATLPSDKAFALLAGQSVIIFVDDLNYYADAKKADELIDFVRRVREVQPEAVLAATCRDGPELGQVKDAIDSPIQRFYADIDLKLRLRSLTTGEKKDLAQGIHDPILLSNPWNPEDYPTPGTITMTKAFAEMSRRFENLTATQRKLLQSLRLLREGGVLPYSIKRLQAVSRNKQLFDTEVRDPDDEIAELEKQGFLRPSEREDRLDPDPAYLLYVVKYRRQRQPCDDLQTLAHVLVDLKDADGLFNLGNALDEFKRLEDAIKVFDQALQVRPTFPEALSNKGVTLASLRCYEKAIDAFDQALHLRPAFPEALSNKGNALADLKRYGDAIVAFEQALQLRHAFPEALYSKGVALANLQRYEDAITAYDQALQLRPAFPDALSNKGAALADLQRYDEAIMAYDQALQLLPAFPEALSNKGVALAGLECYEKAIDAFDLALHFRPDNPIALSNKGNALANLQRYEEAIDAYDQALKINPDYPEALFNKGNALVYLLRYEDGIKVYDQALQLRAAYPEAISNKGVALAKIQLYDEALKAFDLALQLRPAYPGDLSNKGLSLANLRRYDEAIKVFDQALQITPDDAEILYNKGNVLAELRRCDEALRAFDQALSFRPAYPEALNNKGNVLSILQRYDEAINAYDLALQLDPDFAEVLSNKGNTLIKCGRDVEARRALCQAWLLRANLPDRGSSVAAVLKHLGQDPEQCGK